LEIAHFYTLYLLLEQRIAKMKAYSRSICYL
jgi:hypothetical protein